MSTDKSIQKEFYQNFIKIYYDQLSLNLRTMKSDPEQIITFNDLQ